LNIFQRATRPSNCCCCECRIPLIQRHTASPDVTAKPKQDKANKAAAKQKEDEQPVIQDADERLLTDVHGQATAAVDKIVCSIGLFVTVDVVMLY